METMSGIVASLINKHGEGGWGKWHLRGVELYEHGPTRSALEAVETNE